MLKKPARFAPAVGPVSPEGARAVAGLEEAVGYWGGGPSAEEWLRGVDLSWGPAAYAARRGLSEGFALFAPRAFLPRADEYPVGPLDEEAVLLACVTGDGRTRRHLIVRVLKDLRRRGVARVEAIASDLGAPNHVPTRFLLESGWQPVRRASHGGRPYTLVRTDLGNAIEVGELARGLIGKVHLPNLKASAPAPGALKEAVSAANATRAAGEAPVLRGAG